MQLEVHLRFTRIVPDESDCRRSLRLGNLDNNTHITSGAQNGFDHPADEACTGGLSAAQTPAEDRSSSIEKVGLRASECHHPSG
ncbi:hypothetical protein [Brevibacterium oceani]|uniref:hypothetical protein n=1 Tax=Brevibacterium oceani TaxID=358099 RepID=UPI001B32400C|nr:hypothetical protein [Brevibacterium oceani]